MTKKKRTTKHVQAVEVDVTIAGKFMEGLPPDLLEQMVIRKPPSGKVLFIYDVQKPEFTVLARDQNGKVLIRLIILEIPLATPE